MVEKSGLAIINADEARAVALRESFKGITMSIAIDHEADLTAAEIDFAFEPRVGLPTDDETVVSGETVAGDAAAQQQSAPTTRAAGLRFKYHYQGSVVPVFIPGVIGRPTVYSALFATAVGLQYDMNLIEISAALKQYQPPRGRLRVLAGCNAATLIDDTYNASPAAVKEAVTTLQHLTTPGRKLVCLGKMAELGKSAKAAHTAIGKIVAQAGVDRLLVVGDAGAIIAQAAIQAGLPEEAVQRYTDSQTAGTALAEQLQSHDVVLIKGSQIARMEKTVKACLAQPELAAEVLVRQYGNWEKV